MSTELTIAHLAPYSINFPLQEHNGRYDWVLGLASRQALAGMQVVIYSNPDSFIDIPGISWRSTPDTFADSKAANNGVLQYALQDESIDIYHSHFDNLHYEFASHTKKPIIFTQHWWPTPETVELAHRYASPNVRAVPPTKYMYEFDVENGIQTDGFIYHGVDLQTFQPTGEAKSERLLFVGRISPEKNLETAIAAAKKAGVGLDIVGKIAPKNQAYYDSLSDQVDGDQIRYLGGKTAAELVGYYSRAAAELVGYYSRAAAVIFPSDIHEPFGLVAIEAQACGTPVLMRDGGSRGELVANGVSGYLCRSDEEFAAAALKASTLSASDCTAFATKFDVARMDASYRNLYEKLMSQAS